MPSTTTFLIKKSYAVQCRGKKIDLTHSNWLYETACGNLAARVAAITVPSAYGSTATSAADVTKLNNLTSHRQTDMHARRYNTAIRETWTLP